MGINKRLYFKQFGRRRFEIIWVFLQFITKVIGLRDLNVKVPEAVAVLDTVTLTCHYDLESAALYSVRWYFETEEFYRYVATETPPGRDFNTNELDVDLAKSNASTVTIRGVKRTQSGIYQCEVSADAPSFHTESSASSMVVVELPLTQPFIVVNSPQPELSNNKLIISYGDNIKATCISPVSHPPVNFTWYVNTGKHPESNSGIRKSGEAWSELIAYVDNSLYSEFSKKTILLRCETNIFKLYHGSAETELHVMNNQLNYLGHGIPPTNYDQRSRGDPDNSALTGLSILIRPNCILLKFILLATIWTLYC